MSTHTLEYDLGALLPFFRSIVGGFAARDDLVGIGLRRDGELVACALYEGFNGKNMWVHLAAVPGRHWLNRSFLRAGFIYPFDICGVQRLSGYVNESNHEARRFDEHVGFKEEARLRGAAPDGGDVLLYVMWRKDCRYVSTIPSN